MQHFPIRSFTFDFRTYILQDAPLILLPITDRCFVVPTASNLGAQLLDYGLLSVGFRLGC